MADKKITQLTNITGANLADADEFVVVDITADETKAITFSELKTAFDTGTGFVRVTGDTMTGALNVESTITADGLTVDGTANGSGVTAGLVSGQNVEVGLDRWTGSGSNFHQWQLYTDVDDLQIRNVYNNTKGTAFTPRVNYSSNGDISFYEDTGTTAKFFWDSSAESLGIGTSSPSGELHVKASSGFAELYVQGSNSSSGMYLFDQGTEAGLWKVDSGHLAFGTANAERMRIDSSGIDVTGTVTSDGLVIGSSSISAGTGLFQQIQTAGNNMYVGIGSNNSAYVQANGEFRIATGGYQDKVTITTSGNVGIGTSSPSSFYSLADNLVVGTGTGGNGITIYSGSTDSGYIGFNDTASASMQGFIQYNHSGDYMAFAPNGTEKVRIDSSGNVGIGTSSPTSGRILDANGQVRFQSSSSGRYFDFVNDSAASYLDVSHVLNIRTNGASSLTTAMTIDSSGIDVTGDTDTSGLFRFGVNNSEIANNYVRFKSSGAAYFDHSTVGQPFNFRVSNSSSLDTNAMTISSSGNVLTGKSSQTIDTVGVELLGSLGKIHATRDGGASAGFNRKTSDGDIAVFYKDGATVGSIGVGDGDNLYISGHAGSTKGLYFNNDTVGPATNGYTFSDNTTNLGAPTVRFKDAYLSGGVYLGGTTAVNKLDDYEEGTFTPNLANCTIVTAEGKYTKVGQQVFIKFQFLWNSLTGSTNTITGLPFTSDDYSVQSMGFSVYANSGFGAPPANKGYLNAFVSRNGSSINFTWQPDTVNANFNSSGNIYVAGVYNT